MKKYTYKYILVNVSRTWERVRVARKDQEMPLDNIESIDAIIEIADTIFNDKVIQGFINASSKERENNYWVINTKEGMSDWYIEGLAENIIKESYLK